MKMTMMMIIIIMIILTYYLNIHLSKVYETKDFKAKNLVKETSYVHQEDINMLLINY